MVLNTFIMVSIETYRRHVTLKNFPNDCKSYVNEYEIADQQSQPNKTLKHYGEFYNANSGALEALDSRQQLH